MSKSELNPTKNDHAMRFLVSKDFLYQRSHAGRCRAKRVKYNYKFKLNQIFFLNVSIEPSKEYTKFHVY